MKSAKLILMLLVVFAATSYGQTYTTVADGDWTSPATWDASGVPPTASDIPASATINIRHIVFYNTGNTIKNRGTIRIQPLANGTATLNLPTNINVENYAVAPRGFYIINGSFLQCRFVGCNDGQPYSGNNPGAPIQSGTFKNIGGYVELRSANVEVAQDWTSESGGTRLMVDSCVLTGQNFSVSDSTETISRSSISIGWHNSGNFEVSDGTVNVFGVRVQLAGTGGSFKLNSGTVNGDFDYITLRNHIVPFIGTGEIFASPSLTTVGITLDAYCVVKPAKYKPNGKFVGAQSANCSLNLFPAICSVLVPSAAEAMIEGRVLTAGGAGIGRVIVELSGGQLSQPVRALTNGFGFYRFADLAVGETYIVSVLSKRYTFSEPSRIVSLVDNLGGIDFVADGSNEAAEKQRP